MAVLLHLFLIIIFCIFIAVCVVAFRVYRTFRSVSDKFRKFTGKDNGYAGGGTSYSRRYRESDREEIIDSRTPDQANRKIFSESEGEYVDFEEEK